MAVNGRTRQRGAMTALIWKCQGMDVYVPEIVQTFGVQTLEKVHLTVAIERRVRGRVDFNDFTLRNIDPNFHDWELINGMCQDCTAFWRTRAVKRSRGKTDLSFLTCSNPQEPCGQRFYFRVGALEFLIQTSGSAIRNSTVLPAGNGVAHRLRLRSVEGDFCNFDQILTTNGDARQINRVLGFIGVQVCECIRP